MRSLMAGSFRTAEGGCATLLHEAKTYLLAAHIQVNVAKIGRF